VQGRRTGGIVGAFIGVPALIAALSLCEEFPAGIG
jgi:predicted PurR-regulated permease PerM